MPDRDVETIQDLFFYQYAKLIARSAFQVTDGREAKGKHYGFIKNTFRDLKIGRKSWSDIPREDRQLVEAETACAYCGATASLQWEHIVPRSLKINERCPNCDFIQSIHNQVLACAPCNMAKSTKGLYQFYKAKFPDDKKFYDRIPPLLEKKYLKTMHKCHQCAGTLDQKDLDGDGEISVLDIDWVIK